MESQKKIEEVTSNVKKYINTNYALIKLETLDKTSLVASSLISGLIVSIVTILFVFFLSISAGFYLAYRFNDFSLGFIIVAGFYFVIVMILLLTRKRLLENPIRNKIIRKVFTAKNEQILF